MQGTGTELLLRVWRKSGASQVAEVQCWVFEVSDGLKVRKLELSETRANNVGLALNCSVHKYLAKKHFCIKNLFFSWFCVMLTFSKKLKP